ncbi:MAG TPA: NADH:flavin oxidoreductase/NADH oxidase [Stellaceae bacterium]|nr:NADH:flavin oxidoreductase/NADH oxidase [Stellaceae bacterium]
MTSQLFTPVTFGGLTLENRIVIAPMCQYSADEGSATDWHMIHLGHLALSGAGMMILEATAVSPGGRISPDDLGLYSDANEAALSRVLTSLRRHSGIKIGIQLCHAGRKASVKSPWEGGAQIAPDAPRGWRAVGPSAIPMRPGEVPPTALDQTGIDKVLADFAAAAERAGRLGFDAIEIHGAHGYLTHSFLSPISNRREDAYGGSLENRMRFALQVFETVRRAFPAERPVGMRISASDWLVGGWSIEDSVALAAELKRRGIAYIHASSGGISPDAKIPSEAGYQVPFAERIKRETGVTTIAVGLITEPEHAEAIIGRGQADMVAMARAMLYDPRWPWHAAARLGARVKAPSQYLRCQPREFKNLFSDS